MSPTTTVARTGWALHRERIADMQIGLIGLGKMGGNMRERLRGGGHTVVGFDRNPEISDASSLEDMVGKLDRAPRRLGDGPGRRADRRETIASLRRSAEEGDMVIDGGNSRWTDDMEHAGLLAESGHRLRRLRRLRRCLGPEERLRADVRRRRGGRRQGAADLRHAQAGGRLRLRPRRQGRAPGTSPRWCTTGSSTA